MEEHAGAGEAAAFIDCNTDGTGQCCCGLYNARLELAVALRFTKTTTALAYQLAALGRKGICYRPGAGNE